MKGNIIKFINKMNKDLIKESLDNTFKQIQERIRDLYQKTKSDNNT